MRFVAQMHTWPRRSLDVQTFRAKWAPPFQDSLKTDAMGMFKADFYRFFAFGFAGGALLVLGAMGLEHSRSLADEIVPAAQAAPLR